MNTPKTLTYTPSWDLLPRSVRLLKAYALPLVVVQVIPTLITTVGFWLCGAYGRNGQLTPTVVGLVMILVGGVYSLLSYAAWVRLQLDAASHQRTPVPNLYQKHFRYLPRLVGFFLLYALMVTGGMLLLFVPGFKILRKYYLAPFYIVDYDLPIRAAMRRCAADSKPAAGSIWGIFGVTVALGAIGNGFTRLQPVAGMLVALAIGYLYTFGPVLRYVEVKRNDGVVHAKPKRQKEDWTAVGH